MADHYLPKLTQCLQIIDTNDLWKKDDHQNSIGGITLHICEHVNRHIGRYFKPEKNENNIGIENYFPDYGMQPSELNEIVKTIYNTWKDGMENLIKTEEKDIDMHSFYHLVEHTGYHLGQIIDRVQRITGKPFSFCQNGINEKSLKDLIEKAYTKEPFAVDKSRFPMGHFEPILNPSLEVRTFYIHQIPDITKNLRVLLKSLHIDQLQAPYRHDGWTIQQIVHHLADNDMNAYLRFKSALTEVEPLADSYREDLWANLSDYRDVHIEASLSLLEALHSRFIILLHGLSPDDFNRKLRTQVLGSITLDTALQRFVWHNRHHISQIESLILRKGW